MQGFQLNDSLFAQYANSHPIPETPWHDALTVKAAVSSIEKEALSRLGPASPDIYESVAEVPMRDGTVNLANCHKPRRPPTRGSPLIVLAHGGGWISGSRDQLVGVARKFVELYGATVICIGYRLAPEHPFPMSQLDCWDAVRWIADNAVTLGACPDAGFVLGGVSAGGNCMAVAMSLASEERLRYPITGLWLLCPALMDAHVIPENFRHVFLSREQNAEAPIMPLAALESFEKHAKWDRASPLRYPTLSSTGLKGFPPTYMQAGGADPLRDDALIFVEMLEAEGIKTKLDFYPGCPHVHWAYLPELEVSQKTLADMYESMGWLLGTQMSE